MNHSSDWGEKRMVYCAKCGTKNGGDAKSCKKCGEKLYPSRPREETKPKGDSCFGPSKRRERHEQECFRVPRLGAIFGITIGLLIILFGVGLILSRNYGTAVEIWPLAVVIFGIMVVAAVLSASRRRG